jgi:hypothetical protein
VVYPCNLILNIEYFGPVHLLDTSQLLPLEFPLPPPPRFRGDGELAPQDRLLAERIAAVVFGKLLPLHLIRLSGPLFVASFFRLEFFVFVVLVVVG